MEPNVIYVDTREPPGIVSEHATAPRFERRTLETGDFAWLAGGQRVLVERKTISDFTNSVQDGRWQAQVARLVAQADLPIMLIQDALIGHVHRGWTAQGFDSALVVAQLAGLYVAHYTVGQEQARLLALYDTTTKADHASLIKPRKRIAGYGPDEQAALAILASLPGSGPTTARKLLDAYGSVSRAFDAVRSGTCPQVGSKTLRRWQEVLTFDPTDPAAVLRRAVA